MPPQMRRTAGAGISVLVGFGFMGHASNLWLSGFAGIHHASAGPSGIGHPAVTPPKSGGIETVS
ncbi:exported hypothetical protein [Mesorhizobium metallidurans STM 2683]|uniref:Uncharacterized protein n=1 Tax=Mesorhizobium metallidurans STM 2683 TaxID=1297569 RepID=M5EQW0_9HYPH|nr:exported hypothetical protein [Mesorhizobium metallidurans STM 2683]